MFSARFSVVECVKISSDAVSESKVEREGERKCERYVFSLTMTQCCFTEYEYLYPQLYHAYVYLHVPVPFVNDDHLLIISGLFFFMALRFLFILISPNLFHSHCSSPVRFLSFFLRINHVHITSNKSFQFTQHFI